MIIQIDDTYRIETIPLNYVLQRRHEYTNKKGEEAACWKTVGYFGRLKEAVLAIPDDIILSGEVNDVQGVILRLEEIVSSLDRRIEDDA